MKKSLKLLVLTFLAPIMSVSVLAAQTNPAPPKFTIVISAATPEVPSGSDVVIVITTTNISEVLIPMEFGGHGNMPDGFHYDIRDEQGAELAKTVHHDIRPSRPPGSRRSGELAPGKSMEVRAMISDVYPFVGPGKYTIRVWLPATNGSPEKPEKNRIYSNTITITVLPLEPAASTPQ